MASDGNSCPGLVVDATNSAWEIKLYDLQSKKNELTHFMPSLIEKLFNKSEAPKDGLTQPRREAIVDLLNYCMYADNLVFRGPIRKQAGAAGTQVYHEVHSGFVAQSLIDLGNTP
jgi:hypothetical protein